jgi:hypothetical protein
MDGTGSYRVRSVVLARRRRSEARRICIIHGGPDQVRLRGIARPWIGLALLVCTITMVIPRTAALGCILVTGYLGGAAATQVRMQDPWFLFPVALGVMSWLGLYLRDARVRALIPFRT